MSHKIRSPSWAARSESGSLATRGVRRTSVRVTSVQAPSRPTSDHDPVVRFPVDLPDRPHLFAIAYGAVSIVLIVAAVMVLWRGRSAARKSRMTVRQVADCLREGAMSLGQAEYALRGLRWSRRPDLSLPDEAGSAEAHDDNDGVHLAALIPAGVISPYELRQLARVMKPPKTSSARQPPSGPRVP